MRPKELLEKIPGLKRDHLTMWERQRYLRPDTVQRGRYKLRIYSERDATIAKAMWQYYEKGVMPKIAYKRVLHDLGWKEENARGLSLSGELRKVYKGHQETINRECQEVFQGDELTLDELCERTIGILKSASCQELLTELISIFPIKKTASGKYRYDSRET